MMLNVNSPCDIIPLAAVVTEVPEAAGPTLEEVCASVREPSGAPDSVKFQEAGRDFHRPQIEAAVLSVMLNRPNTVRKVCEQLDAGDFFQEQAHTVFDAILQIQHATGTVTPESVIKFLHAADPKNAEVWTDFVDEFAATAANYKHVGLYIRSLKEAAAIRGGKGYCPHAYSETFCANLLLQQLPPTKCIDDAWYAYREGCWTESDVNLIRTMALNVIHPWQRESKRVEGVMKHVEHALQVSRTTFFGANRFMDGRLLINAQNGVIEIREGRVSLIPHSPEYHFTFKLAAAFDESARCPLFAQVLSEALPDEADRHVYQVFCGYILNPTCEHEVSFVNFGPGGTGKSTLAGGIAELLGPDLCSAAGLEELCKSGSYTLPSLKSKMLNLGSELNGTEIEESANFKKLVSGEPLNVRRIYGAPEDMRTTCKLWFLTNNMPRFRGGTDAETRRLRILHFAVQPKKKDSTLKEKLRGELSGILNWMVEGALWLLEKKRIPNGGATTAKVMESFHRGNDPVGAFVRDRCVFDAHEVMVKGSLLDAFREWCDAAGLPSEKLENYFFKTLLNRHPGLRNSRRMIKSKREHCLVGIGLKPGEDAEPSGMNEEQMFAFKEKLRAKLGIVEEQ